jgi:hypothetical protein
MLIELEFSGDGDGGVELQAPTRLFPLPLAV